jgi:hypothetical protein
MNAFLKMIESCILGIFNMACVILNQMWIQMNKWWITNQRMIDRAIRYFAMVIWYLALMVIMAINGMIILVILYPLLVLL